MLAIDEEPTITHEQVLDLLTAAERADFTGNSPQNRADVTDDYATATDYTVGDRVKQSGNYWRAITAGTSTGITFRDMTGRQKLTDQYLELDGNDLAWEWMGTEWYPTYDLNFAAMNGWRLKAGIIASSAFSFGTDGQNFTRSQLFTNFLAMANVYEKKTPYTITIQQGPSTPTRSLDRRYS